MTTCAAVHAVWICEEDKIVSFHSVDGYEKIVFDQYSSFVAFILNMEEQHFRFQ